MNVVKYPTAKMVPSLPQEMPLRKGISLFTLGIFTYSHNGQQRHHIDREHSFTISHLELLAYQANKETKAFPL